MQGNMLYFKYLNKNSKFYFPPDESEDNNLNYKVLNLPTTWTYNYEDDSPWKFYGPLKLNLPDQGWKIHISCTINEAQEILNVVSEYLFENNIPFKHIKNKFKLLFVNSKNANRSSSGKFITIYPSNMEQFKLVLDVLYDKLQDFEIGPYILTDKRWKGSNIFYRYGAFKNIVNNKGQLCIYDEHGQLIPDKRIPYYDVPSIAKSENNYLDRVNTNNNLGVESDLFSNFEFENALTFSNAGGVYSGINKQNNHKVIIKEARPKAGLDGEALDAIDRQKIEEYALKQLIDVKYVVNIIDCFDHWEHRFLIEEYIEGSNLHAWISKNYPFTHAGNINKYAEKITLIIEQLYEAIDQIHNKGLTMGDIQPANILINDELKIKIIDFETSKPIDSFEKPGMETFAYSHPDILKSQERDWYGLIKIMYYMLLPISYSHQLGKNLTIKHRKRIQELYNDSFFNWFINMEGKLFSNIKTIDLENDLAKFFFSSNNNNLHDIAENLKSTLISNLDQGSKLAYGDIRQYEYDSGNFNIQNGGAGVALALTRLEENNEFIYDWIKNNLAGGSSLKDNGLFTGNSGIALILYDHGFKEESKMKIKSIMSKINTIDDLTLRSGLSGIGLALINLYILTDNEEYKEFALTVEERISHLIEQGTSMKSIDWTGIPTGLIDGYSGISVFYSSLYGLMNEEYFLLKSFEFLSEDLEKTVYDEESKTLQTIDNNRLLPFISGGSIGIGVAIWFLQHVTNKPLYQSELEKITNLYGVKSTLFGGLFEGAGSFLIIPALLEEKTFDETHLVKLIDLFIAEEKDEHYYSGNLNLRYSFDLFSGSTGIILGILALQNKNPMYWLPIVNIKKFMHATSAPKI